MRLLIATCLTATLFAADTEQIRKWVRAGDYGTAKAELAKEAGSGTGSLAYAQFLDSFRDPGALSAYEKALPNINDAKTRDWTARRIKALRLLAEKPRLLTTIPGAGNITIPGPLRSFARMAALAPEVDPVDLLPALARNVVINGYQAGGSEEGMQQTEYLKLIVRYLSQSRELVKLAKEGKLRVDQCDSAEAGELLRVLGYRMRGTCGGGDVVLETVNATRAFLTVDSGFPLAELEQALRTNKPFEYPYTTTSIPVMFGPAYWQELREKKEGEFIDIFLMEPQICRLYLGLSKLDAETAEGLRKGVPAPRLKAFAHVLDYYGGLFEIRGGKAVIPGGARNTKAWSDMVGVSADQGPAFFEKLMVRDDGWLAAYYDSVARIDGPVRDYLTDANRMKRFYTAIRGRVTSPGPARPVFRANADMLLLATRLHLDPNGQPHVPGNLEVWRNLFIKHPHGKYDGKLTKSAQGWKEPDDLMEALFGLSRKVVENEPLRMYLAFSDIDQSRAKPLSPATIERLIKGYRTYHSQYTLLTEAPNLSDETIGKLLDTMEKTEKTGDTLLRLDTVGILQASLSFWQTGVRQGVIPQAKAETALTGVLTPFDAVKSHRELFDAGRTAFQALLTAANAPAGPPQDRALGLLAGELRGEDDAHRAVMTNMAQIFDAQRLITLNTLFELADNLDTVAKGGQVNAALINRLAARVNEVQLPRPPLSSAEKNNLSVGYYVDKHIEAQRKLNLKSQVEKAGNDPEKLKEIRATLAPLLRDSLVGLVYARYAPPGGQILLTNPLFVRSHDFLGHQQNISVWRLTEVSGPGWPTSAGGKLAGSLSHLPYSLAEAEQNFLVPSREQALIWGDLVPQILVSAKVPQWWRVSPLQVHYVALHLRHGEALVADAALDAARREVLLTSFHRVASPARVDRVSMLLAAGRAADAIEQILPSELLALSQDQLAADADSPLARELRELAQAYPAELNRAALSRTFGTPKPTLANTLAPSLMNLRTFPTLMGYSSRVLAETWESSNLYYAALADELHLRPAQMNLYVPEWTQLTVERIFATHLEDWPALLRSLRIVGSEIRQKNRQEVTAAAGAAAAATASPSFTDGSGRQ